MDTFDLGIQYEVALEVLGQRKQPMIMAIENENKKDKPSAILIAYYESRLNALRDLQDELDPNDVDLISSILDKNATFEIA